MENPEKKKKAKQESQEETAQAETAAIEETPKDAQGYLRMSGQELANEHLVAKRTVNI